MKHIIQDEDLSLFDIWEIVVNYKQFLLITPLLFGLISFIVVEFFILPQWEATMIIQIGQIGQAGQIGQTGPQLLDNPNNIIVVAQSPLFIEESFNQLSPKFEEFPASKELYMNTIKIRTLKSTDFLELKVNGHSSDIARSSADGALSYLKKLHAGKMSLGLKRLTASREIVAQEIQSLKIETDIIKKQLKEINSFEAILGAMVLHEKSKQIRELNERELFLREQLSPEITFETRTVGDVVVSDRPVYPKKPLVISIAVLIGLFGSILLAFVHNALGERFIPS